MRRLALPVLLVLASVVAAAPRGGVRSLVEAERAFAHHAQTTDTRTAFLAVLDDSSVLFRPYPVDGRSSTLARRATPALLAWAPEFAEVSAADDLGWTTGPWTYRAHGAADTVAAAGHFVSLWKRDGQGVWRLLVDFGTGHAAVAAAPLAVREPARAARGPGHAARAVLLEEERHLWTRAAQVGYEPALLEVLDADARVQRDGARPATGRDAARALLGATHPATGAAEAAVIARSADLGLTRGRLVRRPEGGAPDTLCYVRIWRHQPAGWRIAIDVELPTH